MSKSALAVFALLGYVLMFTHYAGVVAAQELTIERLEKLSVEHKAQVVKQVEELERRESKMRELAQQRDQMRRELDELKRARDELREQLSDQQTRLERERTAATQTRDQLAQLTQQLESVEGSARTNSDEIQKLEEANNELRDTNSNLRVQIEDAEDRGSSCRQELRRATENFEKKFARLETQVSRLQGDLRRCMGRLGDAAAVSAPIDQQPDDLPPPIASDSAAQWANREPEPPRSDNGFNIDPSPNDQQFSANEQAQQQPQDSQQQQLLQDLQQEMPQEQPPEQQQQFSDQPVDSNVPPPELNFDEGAGAGDPQQQQQEQQEQQPMEQSFEQQPRQTRQAADPAASRKNRARPPAADPNNPLSSLLDGAVQLQFIDASGAAADPPPEMQELLQQLSYAASGASGLNLNLEEIISATTASILPFTPRPRKGGAGGKQGVRKPTNADNGSDEQAPSPNDEWPITPRTPFVRETEREFSPADAALPGSEVEALLARLADATAPEERAAAVKAEFLHAWRGYEKYAFGTDELKPISKKAHQNFGMGLTLVDSLDVMIIMGLEEQYEKARDWIRTHLKFGEQENINLFETTIRIMGGLLSAYGLKGDKLFLDKAVDLANAMLFAFDSPTGLPYGTLGLRSGAKYNPQWSNGHSTVAEVGSIQLEWQYLSRLTRNPIFEEKVDLVTDRLKLTGAALYGQFISVDSGHITSNVITFGARVDSVYEYFLKQHILSGRQKPQALEMYRDSMAAMIEHLIARSTPNDLTFVSEMHDGKTIGKMDHLVCFVPGMLALGVNSSVIEEEDLREVHMSLARELMRTCYEFYRRTETGLSPEIVQFNPGTNDFEVDPHATHSLLRPETVESLFVLWRTTHDPIYREWGWEIFQSFVRYCRIEGGGYSGLKDVRNNKIRPNWSNWSDKMESFFLAETLKYLYLLFSPDDLIPLDQYVFNTEAHPLPIAL